MAVTPELIAVALGRSSDEVTTTEVAQWYMWIDDARLLIEARLGDLDELDQAKLDYVVREAVVHRVRRPDDATQVTVSVNDASTSRTYPSGGRVEILDEWWDLLAPPATGKAFEVDTMPEGAGIGGYGVDYVWVTTTDTEPWP